MKFLGLIALSAIVGCHQMPVTQAGRVGFLSKPKTTSTSLKATCERKGNELHVTLPQDQVVDNRSAATNDAFVANGLVGGGMMNPMAMHGDYGARYQVVPGRTSRALTMGWTALPIPFPSMRKVQIAPTVAMTEGPSSRFMQPNMFGGQQMGMYGVAPYGMTGFSGMPMAGGGVMPVGYAQGGMDMQSMQTAQLQQMLLQLQQQQQQSSGQRPPDAASADETAKVKQRAAELEKKVNQLLDILEKRDGADGAASMDSAPGPGLDNPASDSQTALNIEQMGGRNSRSGYRTASDVELWPHSPQNPRQLR